MGDDVVHGLIITFTTNKISIENIHGGFGANMGKKSCDFLGSHEVLVDVGSTKAKGLEVSRGSDKRVVVPEALCMGLKGVTLDDVEE
ncbi:hypothetical protein CFP56_043001 [Quercus suber]|uniref:Uncharacterized protein n=1 Tax=Quercus suber TaxID=58331 RepID=A0AAW0ISC1_QUESU